MRIYADGSGGYVLRSENGFVVPISSITDDVVDRVNLGLSEEEIEGIVENLIDASGNGGSTQVPTYSSRKYDNKRANPGLTEGVTLELNGDTIFGGLIEIPEDCDQLISLGFRLTATGTGNIVPAIYSLNTDNTSLAGAPKDLLAQGDPISVTSGANKTWTANLAIDPGLYWGMLHVEGSCTVNAYRSQGGAFGESTSDGGVNSGVLVSQPYASGLPASISSVTWIQIAPRIFYGVARA